MSYTSKCRCGKKINRRHVIVEHPFLFGRYELVCSDPCARKLISKYAEEEGESIDYSAVKIYTNRKKKESSINKMLSLTKNITIKVKKGSPLTKGFVSDFKIRLGLDSLNKKGVDKFLHELCDEGSAEISDKKGE
jgi:hypothetical protein